MTDDEFLKAFFDRTLPNEGFKHREHLRLAWLLIRRYGRDEAEAVARQKLYEHARAYGREHRYHDTITRFWIRFVAHAIEETSAGDLESLLRERPMLLDSSAPRRHWSSVILDSAMARSAWIEPNLSGLPF